MGEDKKPTIAQNFAVGFLLAPLLFAGVPWLLKLVAGLVGAIL